MPPQMQAKFSPSGEQDGVILYSVNLGAVNSIAAESTETISVSLQVASDVYPGGDRATPPGGGTPLEPTFEKPGQAFRASTAADLPICKASPQADLPAGLVLSEVNFVPGVFTVQNSEDIAPQYTCVTPDTLLFTIGNITAAPIDLPANSLFNVSIERG